MSEIFNLDRVISGAKTIGIGGHVRPDGDCVGACLGLWMYLQTYYPEVESTVYLQDIPESFLFLTGADRICCDPKRDPAPELFFLLDCSDYNRIGVFAPLARSAGRRACIDHHATGQPLAEDNVIRPDVSATCEVLCDLIGEEKITREMAEALYLGLAHDTGVFRYSNTTGHTMRVGGMLIDKGIDASRIVTDTFYSKSYWQKQILGKALLESLRVLDGRVVFTAIRRKEMAFYQVTPLDLEGISAELKNIRGTDVAIFLYETGFQEWKVSMRSSEKVDVSVIGAYFHGGGHKRAAGCTMQGTVYDVVNNLTEKIEEQLKKSETDEES